MIPPTLHITDLAVGSEMPPLVRKLDAVRVIAYAGATWDWHRLHHDPAYAAERNLPGPVVDGQMLGALMSEAILDWLGPRAFVRKLNFRLRSIVLVGQAVRCSGQITAIGSDSTFGLVTIAQQVSVDDRLAADGTALISLPS
jgi:acyl dehydratase